MTGADAARRELGAAQAELMRCLVGDGPTPAGFDEGDVLALRELLLRKRRELVRRAAPALAARVGDDFDRWFTDYRAVSPSMASTSRAEAEAFAAWLVQRGLLVGASAPPAKVRRSLPGRERVLDALARCRIARPRERET